MHKWIPIVAVGLAALACSKDRPAETAGAEGTATTPQQGTVDVESIRMTLLREHPDKADQIRAISISENAGIVTLTGTIDDENLEGSLVNRVRQMQGVRDVRSALRTQPRSGQMGQSQMGEAQTVEEVRMLMLQERPNDSDIIRGLSISTDGGIVTLEGRVYDERMKSDLTRAAKKARGVRDVKDNLQVDQRSGAGAGTSNTGAGGANAIREALRRERPNQSDVIQALTITEEADSIVLRGTVPDEKTKKQIMDTAKKAATKSVRDELKVKGK